MYTQSKQQKTSVLSNKEQQLIGSNMQEDTPATQEIFEGYMEPLRSTGKTWQSSEYERRSEGWHRWLNHHIDLEIASSLSFCAEYLDKHGSNGYVTFEDVKGMSKTSTVSEWLIEWADEIRKMPK